MPIFQSNGKTYNIPDDKVDAFLSSKTDAKLINNEPYSIVRQPSTPRESNNQTQSDIPSGKKQPQPASKPNMGPIPTFTAPNVDIHTPTLELPKSNIVVGSEFEGKPLQSTVADTQNKMMVDRSQEPDYIVGSSIDEFKSYNDWIDSVNNDPNTPKEVKAELNQWYKDNFRNTDNPTSDVRLPQLVRDYLDNNKQEVNRSTYVQGSSMFGGGSFVDTTAKENTPEQLAMVADFLVNSPKGRAVMEDERQYLQQLDSSIDSLEKEIEAKDIERKANAPQTKGMRDYLRLSPDEKDASKSAYNEQITQQVVEYQDTKNARNQLNELKKLPLGFKVQLTIAGSDYEWIYSLLNANQLLVNQETPP